MQANVITDEHVRSSSELVSRATAALARCDIVTKKITPSPDPVTTKKPKKSKAARLALDRVWL
jgi:hypothetical protein